MSAWSDFHVACVWAMFAAHSYESHGRVALAMIQESASDLLDRMLRCGAVDA